MNKPQAQQSAELTTTYRGSGGWVIAMAGAFIAAAVMWALYAAYYPIWDDAYISYRYSLNLMRGWGPVYNPGEHVEGYTNFLWMLLHAAGLAVRWPPWSFSRILGLLCVWTAMAVMLRAWRPVRSWHPGWRTLLAFLLAFNCQFVRWSISGLETALTVMLTVAAAAATCGRGKPMAATAGALWFLAMLSRPDAVVAWTGALAAQLISRERRRFALSVVAVTAALGLPYFLWRYLYFGMFLPATFHTRVGGTLAQFERGIRFTGRYVHGHWPLLLAFVTLPRWRRSSGLWLRTAGFIVLIHSAYIIAVGGDWMRFRFWAVPTPFLLVLAIDAIRSDILPWLRRRGVRPVLAGGVGCVCLSGLIWMSITDQPRRLPQAFNPARILDHRTMRFSAGELMRAFALEHGLPNEWLVTGHGEVAYAAELPTVNPFGLTTLEVALSDVANFGTGGAAHEKENWAYGLAKHPLFVFPAQPADGYSALQLPTLDQKRVTLSVRNDYAQTLMDWLPAHLPQVELRRQ